jgi:predicted dehydrogenase
MGRHHIRGYRTHPNAEVVAVSDLDEERLQQRGDEYGVPTRYLSGEEMLQVEDLDVVSIATPNKFHMPLTIAALEAGCHVLCEKPMALSADQARQMLAAAEKASKRLMINFSYRFTEQSIALKDRVDAWFGQKALSGGGPLIDLGVHRLDLALWLLGYPKPVWVMAGTYNPIASVLAEREGVPYDVEDLAVAMIKLENGAMLEVEASWAANIQERELMETRASWAANIQERELMETRLLGTKGGLVQRNRNETYEFEAEIYIERDGAQFDLRLHSPPKRTRNAMYHLIDSIVRDEPHTATGEEGLLVMEILDAIYASAEKGEPVRI